MRRRDGCHAEHSRRDEGGKHPKPLTPLSFETPETPEIFHYFFCCCFRFLHFSSFFFPCQSFFHHFIFSFFSQHLFFLFFSCISFIFFISFCVCRGSTRKPENSKRHLGSRPLKSPPNFHEKTPRERERERKRAKMGVGEGNKSAKFWASRLRALFRSPAKAFRASISARSGPVRSSFFSCLSFSIISVSCFFT